MKRRYLMNCAMHSKRWLLLIIILMIFSISPVYSSKIGKLELTELTDKSPIVLVGKVESIRNEEPGIDEAFIDIAFLLRGEIRDKKLRVSLKNYGLQDFDPKLKANDIGVFFLSEIKEGVGKLSYWGSIAVFEKQNYYYLPKTEEGKTKNTDTPQKYIVNLIWISGTQPAEYIFVINSKVGFRTVDSFKKFIAQIPESSILEWNPGCRRMGGEPLLSAEEEMSDFKRFCEEHKIIFNLIPAG